jgi:hypothetical protein
MAEYASPDIFKQPPVATNTIEVAETKMELLPAETVIQPAPAETAAPDKPVTEPAPTEQKPEEPRQAEIKQPEPVTVPTVPATPAAQPVNPLESIKLDDFVNHHKGKRDEIFKALGLDEFSIEAIKYYESTGGLAEYAAVKSVDYSKMSDERVLRQQLREELAQLDLEDEDFELIYETRVKNRFQLDEQTFSEREIKAAKLEMKLEADKARRGFIERQKKFSPPERKVEEVQDTGPSPQEQAAMALQSAMSDSAVQQFMNGKKLVLGSGEHTFNYEFTNPQDLLDILFMPDKYAYVASKKDATGQPVTDKNGSYIPDYNRLMKAVAVLVDDVSYDNGLINFGKSLGTKKVVDQMENPTTKQAPTASTEPGSVWQAMKQNGVKWPDLPYY